MGAVVEPEGFCTPQQRSHPFSPSHARRRSSRTRDRTSWLSLSRATSS